MEDKMQGGLGEIKICSSSLHEIYNMSSPETGKTKSTKQSYVENCFLLLIFSRLFGYIHQCAGVRENEGQHGSEPHSSSKNGKCIKIFRSREFKF